VALARLRRGREMLGRKTWRRYFEARVAVMVEWYGLPEEEILTLIAEKMEMGYRGDDVFDEVRKELEARTTRIVERA
jgi:hypothetical protein